MPSSALFAIACLIWGSTFWAITLQLGQVAPAVSVVYRFGLAAVTLFVLCALRGDKLWLRGKVQGWMMLQGFFTFGLSYVCTYNSEQYLVSALVAVLFSLMVFWNPIFNRLAFGQRIGWRVWAAGAVAVFGTVLLFFHSIRQALDELASGGQGHFLLGLVLALTATLASSAGNVVVIKVREHAPNVLLTMAWSMLWGTLMVAVLCLLTGQRFVLPDGLPYWGGLIYLSIFGSVIAFNCYFTLIARLGSQKAVYIGVVTPVISVLLSMQLEHFRPGWIELAGMVLCLSSVAWALKTPSVPSAPLQTFKKAA